MDVLGLTVLGESSSEAISCNLVAQIFYSARMRQSAAWGDASGQVVELEDIYISLYIIYLYTR